MIGGRCLMYLVLIYLCRVLWNLMDYRWHTEPTHRTNTRNQHTVPTHGTDTRNQHMVPCVGSVCWFRVLIPCVGSVCWFRVLAPCVGSVCWFHVLVPCVGSVCCLRMLLPCVASVCYFRVFVLCVDSVCWATFIWSPFYTVIKNNICPSLHGNNNNKKVLELAFFKIAVSLIDRFLSPTGKNKIDHVTILAAPNH